MITLTPAPVVITLGIPRVHVNPIVLTPDPVVLELALPVAHMHGGLRPVSGGTFEGGPMGWFGD